MEEKQSGKYRLRRTLAKATQISVAAGGGALFFCLVMSFVLPLIFSFLPLVQSLDGRAGGGVFPGDGASSSAFALVFSRSVWLAAARTLALALLSTVLALAVGLPAAFFTAARIFPGRKLLLSLSAVPLCMPPLLVALGYVMFWGMHGVANRLAMELLGTVDAPFTFLYSSLGIVLAQGFYNFPLVMKTCSDSWSQLQKNQQEAAQLLGAGPWRVFRTITLAQLLPAVATSAMVVFLYCFFSFVLVLVFGGVGISVLEVEIYQAARSRLNFPRAAALALVETALALAVVWLYSLLERRGRENKGLSMDGCGGFGRKKVGGWQETAGFVVLLLAVALFFFFPLLQLVLSAFSGTTFFAHFKQLFSRPGFYRALKNTVLTAGLSSALAVGGALFYSLFLKEWDAGRLSSSSFSKKSSFFNKGLLGLGRILPLLPMAVSSVVLAVGATSLASVGLPGLGGSPWMLVALQAALHWPLAFRQISGALDKIPDSTRDAATLLSTSRLDGVFRVHLPLCRKKTVTALGFCFALGCGDTTVPLVLALPRFETLALYTYSLAGAYRFAEACCSGVVLAALTMPIFFASEGNHTFGKKKIGGRKHG